jgi:hypothetical protein
MQDQFRPSVSFFTVNCDQTFTTLSYKQHSREQVPFHCIVSPGG